MMFFFFNDTATTEIYTLSLHDALPIFDQHGAALEFFFEPAPELLRQAEELRAAEVGRASENNPQQPSVSLRSEEHTSELQSRQYLVCRLLLEKKKKNTRHTLSI